MLTIERRHNNKCPHHNKGPHYLKCKCPLRACGTIDGKRVRLSLKTRDLGRASRRLVELTDRATEQPRKSIADAITAFQNQHADWSVETNRKYSRVLQYLADHCRQQAVQYVDQITLEVLDSYATWRGKTNWTWIKEIEILRQFLSFCMDREWIAKNPAKKLKRPKMTEANDVVPFNGEEIVKILTATTTFGRYTYERLRARAMVLIFRHTGMRVSDVVTLSREHIQGRYLVKKAIKNRKWIRVELPAHVLEALEMLPRPKAASVDSQAFFAGGTSSLRSLVKGAERTMAAVFKRAGVEDAFPHRFRHTLASEILGAGGTIEDAANVLGDDPTIVRRHYAKWIPAVQIRQDSILRKIHEAQILAQSEGLMKSC